MIIESLLENFGMVCKKISEKAKEYKILVRPYSSIKYS